MKQEKTFRSNWNKKDEVCPTCSSVTKEAKGLTKQNLKKMFRKPTPQDYIILIIIGLTILGAYTYSIEVKQYQEIIRNPRELCTLYYQNVLYGNFGKIDLKNITIIENDKTIE